MSRYSSENISVCTSRPYFKHVLHHSFHPGSKVRCVKLQLIATTMGVRKIVLVETCSVCQVVQEPVCFQIILKMFQTTGLSLLRACPETGVRLVPACPCLRPNHHVLLRVARETKRQRETGIEAWWKGVGGRETF
jgi:hypothetical protein